MRSTLALSALVGSALAIALMPAPSEAQAYKATQEECALLDDEKTRGKMDGLLRELLVACGRAHELGGVVQEAGFVPSPTEGGGSNPPDALVNDPSVDSGTSTTQSETAIIVSPTTGTFCSHYNDAGSGIGGGGFTGFSRSVDGGVTWDDRGALPNSPSGDPTVVWRAIDDKLYASSLRAGGLGVWSSDDDCLTFDYLADSSTGSDDKEIMAVDNNVASDDYGRLYIAWTDFGAGGRIFVNYSDNSTTWSTPVAVSAVGADVQGAWPVVAPNGDLYVAWLRWNPFPSGNIDIEIVRSTDGGDTFAAVANPLTDKVNPRDSAATSSCGRPALNENIRYLPSPQLAITPDGALHVVYSYDPDGFGTGDVVDVFYRKSIDGGATWGTEIQLNDDLTDNDQYFPTLSVGPSNIISTAWYDRRLDAPNQLQDYYRSISFDGGASWEPNERVSDVSSPVRLDPGLATCYHGDYDQQVQIPGAAVIQWSDDRRLVDTEGVRNDPDVYVQTTAISTDFLLTGDPTSQDICTPADAIYQIDVLQFEGFTEPVTLSAAGEPAGSTVGFSVNPVMPPGSSDLSIGNTAAAPAGPYSITVTGTSSPSAIVQETTVSLNIFTIVPGMPGLTLPNNGATDVVLLPTLEWTPGEQATSYFVEVATDAGFSDVVFSTTVAGLAATVDSPLDPVSTYYWRVTPMSVCGNGTLSSVFSFTTRPIPPILLVDDDDNAPDVRIFYTNALDSLGLDYDIWDTADSDNEPSALELAPYQKVVWFSGDSFGGSAGPGASGESALGTWLDAGGCLFLSSQDYHFDRGLTTFMQDYLGAGAATDDTGDYTSVTGQPGSLFEAMGPYTLDYATPGVSDFSDIITENGTGVLAFEGDNSNGAAVQKSTPSWTTVYLTFPWVAIAPSFDREAVLSTALNACGLPAEIFADGFESGDTSGWEPPE